MDVACAGCAHLIDETQGWGQLAGLYGYLCPTCLDLLIKRQGRYCNTCIRAARKQWPGQSIGVLNRHRMRHSQVIDHCVDAAILPFLDGFNREVTPSSASCQGEPRLASMPAMPPRAAWIHPPYVMVSAPTGDVPTALDWADANHDRYKIASVKQRWDLNRTVSLTFWGTPTTWLG